MSKITCPKCSEGKTRYEVKIKNKINVYWACWPCYDKTLVKAS